MRIVFMGTPDFAASVLSELASQHDVVAVYTRPDAVRGRGKQLVPSPVKAEACERGIPVFTPKTLRDAAEQQALAALEPDVICVAAYGMLLPAEVLGYARQGVKNVISLQPFGCIANHIVSKGVEKRIKQLCPDLNMLSLDFDSGVSDVNITNRMLLFTENLK